MIPGRGETPSLERPRTILNRAGGVFVAVIGDHEAIAPDLPTLIAGGFTAVRGREADERSGNIYGLRGGDDIGRPPFGSVTSARR